MWPWLCRVKRKKKYHHSVCSFSSTETVTFCQVPAMFEHLPLIFVYLESPTPQRVARIIEGHCLGGHATAGKLWTDPARLQPLPPGALSKHSWKTALLLFHMYSLMSLFGWTALSSCIRHGSLFLTLSLLSFSLCFVRALKARQPLDREIQLLAPQQTSVFLFS